MVSEGKLVLAVTCNVCKADVCGEWCGHRAALDVVGATAVVGMGEGVPEYRRCMAGSDLVDCNVATDVEGCTSIFGHADTYVYGVREKSPDDGLDGTDAVWVGYVAYGIMC